MEKIKIEKGDVVKVGQASYGFIIGVVLKVMQSEGKFQMMDGTWAELKPRYQIESDGYDQYSTDVELVFKGDTFESEEEKRDCINVQRKLDNEYECYPFE